MLKMPTIQRVEDNRATQCVIFDADDTLWSTQELYDQAKGRFAEIVSPELHSRKALITQLDLYDAKAVQTQGFSRNRFGDSMQAVYMAICQEAGTAPDLRVQNQLRQVANEVFRRAPSVYPDAHSALQRFQSMYRLFLLTKGDEEVQRERISRSGLTLYFEQIYIVPDKTASSYTQILQGHGIPQGHSWAIGNSARSDINPALAAGLRAVMIPNTSWVYEIQQLQGGEVKVVDSLTEAADHILTAECHADLPASTTSV
ncbi:hypothetical protein CTI14_01805 [Methylobacterium radiotolerans]|nr:hypothetical protein CTI14_01805 [Methylobacterium radiotolerans]